MFESEKCQYLITAWKSECDWQKDNSKVSKIRKLKSVCDNFVNWHVIITNKNSTAYLFTVIYAQRRTCIFCLILVNILKVWSDVSSDNTVVWFERRIFILHTFLLDMIMDEFFFQRHFQLPKVIHILSIFFPCYN